MYIHMYIDRHMRSTQVTPSGVPRARQLRGFRLLELEGLLELLHGQGGLGRGRTRTDALLRGFRRRRRRRRSSSSSNSNSCSSSCCCCCIFVVVIVVAKGVSYNLAFLSTFIDMILTIVMINV